MLKKEISAALDVIIGEEKMHYWWMKLFRRLLNAIAHISLMICGRNTGWQVDHLKLRTQ
jgi:hypothetical protein